VAHFLRRGSQLFAGQPLRHALGDSPFSQWGLKRIVRDLLAIPGRLCFDGSQLNRIDLLETHPYAHDLLICLEKYTTSSFGE